MALNMTLKETSSTSTPPLEDRIKQIRADIDAIISYIRTLKPEQG